MKNTICKNDNLFFEMFDKALKAGDRDAANKVQVALTAFVNEPVKQVQRKIQAINALKSIQGVSVSTDFEQLITNSFNVTVQEDNFDLGYERVYRSVPLDPQRDFWEIYDVQNGLSFRLVEEGQEHLDGV